VWSSLVIWTLLAGCKPVREAPEDLDGVLRDTWSLYVDGDDDDLGVVALALAELLADQAEALQEQATDGTQSRLTDEDLRHVALFAPPDDDGTWSLPDPALARPIYLATVFNCTREQLEPVLYALDQNAQYEAYDAYERTHTSSLADFRSGSSPTITWEAEATASNAATGAYTELLLGGLRRVPMPPLEADHPLADVLTDPSFVLARTWIPFPASTERDNVSFDQDYQIEIYLPWGEDRMMHLYGIWRQLSLGALGDMESDGVARITLNNLADWDETTERLCAEGAVPVP
jgi:hypothetical protein